MFYFDQTLFKKHIIHGHISDLDIVETTDLEQIKNLVYMFQYKNIERNIFIFFFHPNIISH